MQKIWIDWPTFGRDLAILSYRVSQIGVTARDAWQIVGITRGGLIPAVYLSHQFGDLPIVPFEAKAYREGTFHRVQIQDNVWNRVTPSHNILIVDDLRDTGNTAKAVFDLTRQAQAVWQYNLAECRVAFVSVYRKAQVKAVIEPMVCARTLPNNWIVFPYEQDEQRATPYAPLPHTPVGADEEQ